MKLPAIKKLVANYEVAQLEAAENALLEEATLEIEVDGDDEGEQLTHIIGALEIKRAMENGTPEKDALRAFTQRVRNSIN